MEFEVQDMTCGGCANAITRAVTAADPGAKLDIDVAAKIVKVESAQGAERVQAVIEAAGFHPALRSA
ncbi:heavy-metal-associated domain-containing protein [Burkholderia multivorans]|uniref:heavy-metal-associated domain-containing protein n=1 Tax=Burkholderia multivorans TaxID=87883 RepID=UPI000CFE4CDB|nr:heavy-metal-associated domain-containing protein [Burkholderia multivorans]MBH9662577.1 heavy-metal-associated domain-containing protein [Burkholderia multivorans]MBU9670761.1 heavy-metal-associated domain-containing protein [Burkholderia multivorans]MCA8264465.1 heavy-metal-associated domain-containing protein [Burkholderia multivorans]MCL4629879.1 heavy-metal-associated domain-containing protein [Burkholderia multivorans]MCO1362101.1 heavy-metal-associated domain-containing protein [Burkh